MMIFKKVKFSKSDRNFTWTLQYLQNLIKIIKFKCIRTKIRGKFVKNPNNELLLFPFFFFTKYYILAPSWSKMTSYYRLAHIPHKFSIGLRYGV